MQAQMIDTGQVRLHVVTAGNADAPPVVLLHGFPSFWQTWRHQIGCLAEAGFHVIAPDMRGYNLSEKPKGVENYSIDRVAGDIVGLLRALGHDRASIVGHDWGAVVGWALAIMYPSLVDRLVVINVSHPRISRRKMFTLPRLMKWWYMLFFQLPWLPEMLLRRPRTLTRVIRSICAHPEAFTDEDVRTHVEAFRQPGAATATLNYYRAMLRHAPHLGGNRGFVQAPTLVLWGDRDPIIGEDLLEGIESAGASVRVHHIRDGGHWLPQETPDAVNQQVLAFLSPQRV